MQFKVNPKMGQRVTRDDVETIAKLSAAHLEVRAFGSAVCVRDLASRDSAFTRAIAERAGFRVMPSGALLEQVGWMIACHGP